MSNLRTEYYQVCQLQTETLSCPKPGVSASPRQLQGKQRDTWQGIVLSDQLAAPSQFTAKSQMNLCNFSLLCLNTDWYVSCCIPVIAVTHIQMQANFVFLSFPPLDLA